ncbi:gliding motility lipoprotein GldH [Pedobacter sp. HMF7056]|uniref:Gliding motility lipoprotein GldH n=2 Tax=Hufsiella ginkgonis TaxID=2695274 RepID=A0A7K1XVB6_9SPHI|nr:gliding motility lipoprotein GldH [Hufsiella ginkgonis]
MLHLAGLLAFLLQAASCTDSALVDTNKPISNRNWSYINKITVPVTITDASKNYQVSFNLRHTSDYKYSNIFIVLSLTGPGLTPYKQRKEFQLAWPDGEWLGSGSGNLYSYQMPLTETFRFPAKGTYTFVIEQNMRDNPLREISDVGLRVAPIE